LIKKCDRENARRRTDTLTDANRFYNRSHAICCTYGTDTTTNINANIVIIFIMRVILYIGMICIVGHRCTRDDVVVSLVAGSEV